MLLSKTSRWWHSIYHETNVSIDEPVFELRTGQETYMTIKMRQIIGLNKLLYTLSI
jgi:hypothetical protein